MISSIEEAIVVLQKYKNEGRTLWFSTSGCGIFCKGGEITVEEVSEFSLRLATPSGAVLVSWDMLDIESVEYFEPRDVPVEHRGELEFIESLWRFVSRASDVRSRAVLLLTTLR